MHPSVACRGQTCYTHKKEKKKTEKGTTDPGGKERKKHNQLHKEESEEEEEARGNFKCHPEFASRVKYLMPYFIFFSVSWFLCANQKAPLSIIGALSAHKRIFPSPSDGVV